MSELLHELPPILDGYVIKDVIGQGSFSVVYKIHPVDLPHHYLALKIVKDVKYEPLLLAEAKILDDLNHPQIPRPYKLGAYENRKYLIIDYIPIVAINMRNLLKKHSLNEKEADKRALEITIQILDALNYAHSKGFVHKDLKPSNIGFNENFQPILLDFNIAKQLLDEKIIPIHNTDLGSQLIQVGDLQRSILGGTEGYASPEQRRIPCGNRLYSVDTRSDIYSIGAILYELLTGYLPHGSYKKASEVTDFKWIDRILDKALASNPEQRFQTAKEMSDEIKKGLNGDFDSPNYRIKNYLATSAIFTLSQKIIKTFVSFNYRLFNGILFLLFLPLRAIQKIIWLYSFRWLHTSNDPFIPCILTSVLWILTITAPLIVNFNQSQLSFYNEIKESHFTGTIIYKTDNSVCSFKAKDLLSNNIPIKEFLTPKIIGSPVYLGNGYIAWLSSDETTTVYLTSMINGSTRKIISSNELPERIFGEYVQIKEVCGSYEEIIVHLANDTFYLCKNLGDPLKINGSVVNRLNFNNLSNDGKYRVRSSLNLYIEKSVRSSNWVNIPLYGVDPIWIKDEIDH